MADQHWSGASVRIRQVRPEFWSDALVAALPPGVRLLYIGLWCVADDYGWFRFNETEIAALLFPYESPRKRLREVHNATSLLIDAERLVAFECGCAWIPTLSRHQVNGGKKSAMNRDKHLNGSHSNDRLRNNPEVREVRVVGNVRERNGSGSGNDPDANEDGSKTGGATGLRQGDDGKWVTT